MTIMNTLLYKKHLTLSERKELEGLREYCVPYHRKWPVSLHYCANLHELDARFIALKEIPQELGDLCRLKKLYISQNKLENIGPCVGACTLLEYIDVSINSLGSLPPQIGKLFSLNTLDASDNYLCDLPPNIGECISMRHLNVGYNELTTLPDEIGNLISLQTLCLSGNKLHELTTAIGKCVRLQMFDVSYNQLNHYPNHLGKLGELKRLNLQCNNLTNLPASVGNYVALEQLDITFNRLKALPQEIKYLRSLRILDVSENRLCELPPAIGECVGLEHLNVSANSVTTLPEEIGKLQNMKILNASNNRLLGMTPSIGQCVSLELLDIHSNRLKTLPHAIGNLHMLKILDVSNNRIRELPKTISACNQLWEMKLHKNELIGLPCEFIHLQNLERLTIAENPLNIPWVTVNLGVNSIVAYLKALQKYGGIPNKRRNLMVLGNTLAGKSSFVGCLLTNRSTLTQQRDRTHVLQRHTLTKYQGNQRLFPLKIRINDFGGQESYNATTALFWTLQSVFLVLFDVSIYTKARHKSLISNWVEWIASKIPKARIFLIATHADKVWCGLDSKLASVAQRVMHEESIVRSQIKAKIEQFTGRKKTALQHLLDQRPTISDIIYPISSKTCEGVQKVWDAICSFLADNESFPEQILPLPWFQLQSSLANAEAEEHKTWLTWDQVTDIGAKVDLIDQDNLKQAIEYLHLSGYIVWDKDDDVLKHIVFHQPHELISILKAIISHDLESQLTNRDSRFYQFSNESLQCRKRALKSKGMIKRDLLLCILKDVLPNDESKERSLDMIIKLLVRFDLAHVSHGTHLCHTAEFAIQIPWYLPDKRPNVLQWTGIQPMGTKQVVLKLVFAKWSPPGFFESLGVRLHRHLSFSKDWKTGVYGKIENQEFLLELQQDDDHESIIICFRGCDLTGIWQVALPIQRDVNKVLELWHGVICDMYVICPSCMKRRLKKPYLFEMTQVDSSFPNEKLMCGNEEDEIMIPADHIYPPRKVLEKFTEQYGQADVNYLRYAKLIAYGSELLRKIFENNISGKDIHVWAQENKNTICQQFKGPMKWMKNILLPGNGHLQLGDLDTSVLIKMFSKLLPGFEPPMGGWDRPVDVCDTSQAADIMRLGKLRNEPSLAHNPRCELVQTEFDNKWHEAETVIRRLGGCADVIFRLKFAKMPH